MGTIRNGAELCIDLFDQLRTITSIRSDPTILAAVQDQYQRFKIWSSNIGVFAELHASLDFRIREHDDIRETFLGHLKVIESRLRELSNVSETQPIADTRSEDVKLDLASCNSAGSSLGSDDSDDFQSWTASELIQSTSDNIDWLHKLSNLIRKASFSNQTKKANAHPLKDELGNDATELLAQWFCVLVKREFQDLRSDFLQRLVASMILRRRQLAYRRSRQKRWDLRQEAYIRQRKPDQLLEAGPVVSPEPLAVEAPIQQDAESNHNLQRSGGDAATFSVMTLTTLDRKQYNQLASPSRISQGTSAPLNAKSRTLVPPPPKSAATSRNFVCEYCCFVLDGQLARDRGRWADHVKRDINPYICVADDCDDPLELFPTQHEWLTHMQLRHLTQWHCVHKSHSSPAVFEAEEQFKNHMRMAHVGKFTEDQLFVVANSSAHPRCPTFEVCPLCSDESGDLEIHIGDHLRNLALLSLPWPEDESTHSGPVNDSTTDGDDSQHGIRSTIADFESEDALEILSSSEHHDSNDIPFIDDVEPSRAASYSWMPKIANQHKMITRAEQIQDSTLAAISEHQNTLEYALPNKSTGDLEVADEYSSPITAKRPKDLLFADSASYTARTTPLLTPLFGAASPQNYIVVVPDIASSRPETWCAPTGKPWLKTLFETAAPNAQFFFFSHGGDASTAFKWEEIRNSAHELLRQLINLRREGAYAELPLHIICFGLGGLLVKEALSFASGRLPDADELLFVLSGVTFFSTPHSTLDDDSAWETVSMIPMIGNPSAKKWKFDKGETTAMALACERFEELSLNCPLLSIFEIYETTIHLSSSVALPFQKMMAGSPTVVGKDRCISNAHHGRSTPLHTDYRQAVHLDVEGSALRILQGFIRHATATTQLKIVVEAGRRDARAPALAKLPTTAHQYIANRLVFDDTPPPADPILPYYRLPVRSKHRLSFKKEETLHQIEQSILPPPHEHVAAVRDPLKNVLICGTAGVGKTHMAAEFVHLHHEKYDAVFWLEAGSAAELQDGFSRIAVELGLATTGSQDQTVLIGLVRAWLAQPIRRREQAEGKDVTSGILARWLVVFDDVRSPRDFSTYWPRFGRGSVLVTSRNGSLKRYFDTIATLADD